MKRFSFITILLALAASAGCTRDSLESASCAGAFEEGDLVISEVQANPFGTDADQEYFEIYNATDAEVNLGGLSIVAARADDTGEKSHRMSEITLASGGYLALGNTDKDLLFPHLDYGYKGDLGSLRNSEAKISLYCAGVLVDEIAYGDTTNGFAVELGGDLTPTATANDDPANLCDASKEGNEYAMDNFGTPGEANGSCDTVVISACDSIAAGDLVITEVMADYDTNDSGNEFVEIYNASGAEIEATGLVITSARADGESARTHEIQSGSIADGEYWVLTNSTEALTSFEDYSYGTSIGDFRNDAGGRIELTCGTTSVDVMVFGNANKGRSIQLTGADKSYDYRQRRR